MLTPDPALLDPGRCLLLLIDAQERLFPAMPEAPREQARRHWESMAYLAGAVPLALLASEQYPQGLGPTLPGLLPPGAEILPKTSFSVMREPVIARRVADHIESGRRHVLVMGMEAHICVALSALDLLSAGCAVSVIADACVSRREADWRRGLDLCRDHGARVLSAETAMFGLLERAGGPVFKEISRRIR